jgi:kynurenine formamidase
MCGNCVMDKVAARLGRRGVLAALAAGAAAASSPAAAQRTTSFRRVVDMTHTLREDFPTFEGTPPFTRSQVATLARDGYNMFRLTYDEHVGTHIDAPRHFTIDGATVDALPIEQLVCPLVIIDLRARAAADADCLLVPDDLLTHERAHGPIPEGACVALQSGWAARAGGAGFRNLDAGGVMRFPGFRPDTVPALLARGVRAVAVDTLSLDHGSSKDFAFHAAWLGAGRWGMECTAGLDDLPPVGATLIAGAPKFAGSTGGPSRVLAVL